MPSLELFSSAFFVEPSASDLPSTLFEDPAEFSSIFGLSTLVSSADFTCTSCANELWLVRIKEIERAATKMLVFLFLISSPSFRFINNVSDF